MPLWPESRLCGLKKTKKMNRRETLLASTILFLRQMSSMMRNLATALLEEAATLESMQRRSYDEPRLDRVVVLQ